MAGTRKILTAKEVEWLLGEYIATQSAAAEKAEQAYDHKADAERDEELEKLRQDDIAEQEKANEKYNTQLVKSLIQKRRLAEQVANWGLSDSGIAAAKRQGVVRSRQIAEKNLAKARDAAMEILTRKRNAIHRDTDAKKASNRASSQRTLNNRIAEKRLSLRKLMF
ncbi:MAG: hypothetical protein J6Q42_02505 [Clostridia bacterium]|nr:hypothetical protein [Clostridia bacterium]